MKKLLLLVFSIFLIRGETLGFGGDIYGLPDADGQAIRKAFDALFNEDFQKADEILAPLKPRAAKHSMIQTAFVIRYWWEMASQVLETDADASKPFTQAAEKCLEISERSLSSKKNNEQALLSLATTLGLMSRWSAANRAWVPAYFRGNKAGEYARRALAAEKKGADAYMTLGAFIYGKEKMRQYLSKSEQEQNPDDPTPSIEGLSQLRKAYTEGLYFKEPAGLLLAGILTNEKPQDAVPLLNELREKLPRSAFVHVLLITALYNTGHAADLEEEVEEFETMLKEGVYPARYKPQAHFVRGLTYFRKKEMRSADQAFKEASKGDPKNAYTIWGQLYRGYTLDVMKKREMAKSAYRKVLALPRRFASHDHAKARLEKPFKSTDPELKKLEL